jgi:hypothetical protein
LLPKHGVSAWKAHAAPTSGLGVVLGLYKPKPKPKPWVVTDVQTNFAHTHVCAGGGIDTSNAAEEAAMDARLRWFRCLLLHRGFGVGVVGDTVGDPSVPAWQRLHGPPGPGSCTQDTNKTV